MKNIRLTLVCLLLASMLFSVAGCSSNNSDTGDTGDVNTSGETVSTPENSNGGSTVAPTNGTPENDTATGLKVIKIDTTGASLTDEQ